MTKRYIGFNDTTGGEWDEYEYSGGYEDGIEDVLLREIRMRGGLLAMMKPADLDDPKWEGFSRVVITIGPEEDEEGDE
jgi:hypothetical protein